MAAQMRISPLGGEDGFTLIEIVCVLAMISLLAALILPAIPRGTSRTRLEAFALQAAGLLKTDRLAAMQRRMRVATELDPISRSIRSGATGSSVVLPPDVGFDAVLATRCNQRAAGRTIDFFPSGMSCGGTIALSRPGGGFQVRVNWLTGGVEVVPVSGS
jgi:general secretion pathway protein H